MLIADTKRIFGLDILRALAIFAVLWSHTDVYIPAEYQSVFRYTVIDGVSVFFVLSGFLIGGILIKLLDTQPATFATLWTFWVRRWMRTVPNYLLIMSILVLIALVFGTGVQGLGSYLIFSQNLYSPNPVFFPESWSLSVEEWFYLLIPMLVFVLIRVFNDRPRWALLLTALIVLSAVTLFRYYRFQMHAPASIPEWDIMFRKQVITRLDAIMYGVIGAYAFRYHPAQWHRYRNVCALAGASLALLAGFLTKSADGMYTSVFSFSLFSAGILLCLPYLNSIKRGSGVVYRAVTHVSLISYSLYLVNHSLIQGFVINDLIDRRLPLGDPAKYALYWGLSIGSATLLYRYFEIPVLRLRDRMTERRKIKKARPDLTGAWVSPSR